MNILFLIITFFPALNAYGSINELEFNRVSQDFLDVFTDDINNFSTNVDLVYYKKSQKPVVSLVKLGDTWNFRFPETFLETKSLTHQSLFAFACHELGHILGGAPSLPRPDFRSTWVNAGSVEGQADYYTSLYCLPKLYDKFNIQKETAYLNFESINPEVTKVCMKRMYSSRELFKKCLWVMDSALQMIKVIDEVDGFDVLKPSLLALDEKKVQVTIKGYPSLQCRLDTLAAGGFCGVTAGPNYMTPMCTEKRKLRPRCWYHPESFPWYMIAP